MQNLCSPHRYSCIGATKMCKIGKFRNPCML
uniref:Uncharacterized protein n=1 Tax=Arundo donax TaxID=35708 RepID=A0A0A9B9R9_ARUDO